MCEASRGHVDFLGTVAFLSRGRGTAVAKGTLPHGNSGLAKEKVSFEIGPNNSHEP